MSALQTTFASFGVRNFRYLWFGSLLSTTAFMTSFLLVPIVAYNISESYTDSGIAAAGSGIAMFLLGPFGGVIADRYPKKPLVLAGQTFPALLILGTGFLILTDRITVPLLFITTLLMGIGFAAMGPARQSWLGDLIPRRLLANGVALQQMAQSIARVLGPMIVSIVGVVFQVDAGWLYLLVASFFLVVIPLTTMLPWTGPSVSGADRPPALRELRRGFSYLKRNRRLWILWLFWMAIVICSFAPNTLLPGILDREFGRDSLEAMPIFLTIGVASIAISLPLAVLVSGRWAWPSLFACGVLTMIGFVLTAISPTYEVIIVMGFVLGAGSSGVMLVTMSLMMTNSRQEYFGRVMSFVMLGYGAQSFVAPLWGGIAEAIGGREALVVVGLASLAATALLLLAWLRVRRLPMEAGSVAADMQTDAEAQPPAAPSPALSPLFAARIAPVALMGGQRAGSSGWWGD